MKNEEKFKTIEEREEAFNHMCCARQCSECKYRQIEGGHWCSFAWLSDAYEEPKPGLPFKVSRGRWYFIEEYLLKDNAKDITIYSFAKRSIAKKICDRLNAAALAWHERMCKEEKGANQ